MTFFKILPTNQILLKVRSYPKSSQKGIKGTYTNSNGVVRLKIYVHEPAVEFKANEAIMAIIAKTFGCSPSEIIFHNGHHGLDKDFILPLYTKQACIQLELDLNPQPQLF
jgi:uncharacterized protein YggU (UPF0235/DUF167 family)